MWTAINPRVNQIARETIPFQKGFLKTSSFVLSTYLNTATKERRRQIFENGKKLKQKIL